jgi:DNA-binding transcriptional regulator YiaG
MLSVILPSYETSSEHDGRPYSFSVSDLEVLQCQNCQAIVLTDAANERIENALRTAVGLLSPAEIRRKREALCLNQQQLADLLRISMHTLSRWETGAQIQQRAMDLYLRTFFEVPEARRFLGGPSYDASSRPVADATSDILMQDAWTSDATGGWSVLPYTSLSADLSSLFSDSFTSDHLKKYLESFVESFSEDATKAVALSEDAGESSDVIETPSEEPDHDRPILKFKPRFVA